MNSASGSRPAGAFFYAGTGYPSLQYIRLQYHKRKTQYMTEKVNTADPSAGQLSTKAYRLAFLRQSVIVTITILFVTSVLVPFLTFTTIPGFFIASVILSLASTVAHLRFRTGQPWITATVIALTTGVLAVLNAVFAGAWFSWNALFGLPTIVSAILGTVITALLTAVWLHQWALVHQDHGRK